MNKKDLDALAGLYKSVYSPADSGEYLSEDYLTENPKYRTPANDLLDAIGRGFKGIPNALTKPRPGLDSALNKPRGVNVPKPAKPAQKSALAGRVGSTNDIQSLRAGQEQARKDQLARASRKPPTGSVPPATQPATTRPATPGAGAKVAPTAPKPATPAPGTKAAGPDSIKPKTPNPLMKDMPGQNKAELDQLRGNAAINSISQSSRAKNILSGTAKSATANQIGKASLDRSAAATEAKPPAPKIPSTTNQTGTAFAKTTPALSSPSKTPAPTLSSKPTTNQTATAYSSPSIVKPTPPTTPNKKPGPVMSSYEWPSAKTIKDIAGAYASIYEAKKKDQDEDGDNDFADVRIARMIASGMSKAEAIAAVKNKEYNEEFESWLDSLVEEGYDLSDYTMEEMFDSYLEEATRMRKELGKEGEIATRKELAARSRAYKRSGSVDRTIAAAERGSNNPYIKHKRDESDADRKKREERQSKTLRGLAASRRKSVRGEGGLRGYAAKVEGSDKDLQSARQRAMSAGTLTPREKKELGEVYEIVASYLLENNFATTINDANAIIENMSEVWLNQILENAE
jgi:hypothetical protein